MGPPAFFSTYWNWGFWAAGFSFARHSDATEFNILLGPLMLSFYAKRSGT